MSVKCIKDKPIRPLEIDLSGNNGNLSVLTDIASILCPQYNLDEEKIIFELKMGSYEEAFWIFESYFGDDVIIYR